MSQALIADFWAFLKPQHLAYRSMTTRAETETIVSIVSNRLNVRARERILPPATDGEQLQNFINDTYYVLKLVSAETIAADNFLDVHAVGRILDIIR